MDKNFFKPLSNLLLAYSKKKILILIDEYFLYNPKSVQRITLIEYLELFHLDNLQILNTQQDLEEIKMQPDLIIDLFFSTQFVNPIHYFNKLLKSSLPNTRVILFLPYSNFTNFSLYHFNPVYFKLINHNHNFKLLDISFTNDFGKVFTINDSLQIEKLFFQSSAKKNQNFIDMVNKKVDSLDNTHIIFNFNIINVNKIPELELFSLNRQPRNLSGHSLTTHVDVGALLYLKKIIEFKSFLDIGCGPGGVIDYLQSNYNTKCLGIDGDNSILRKNSDVIFIHDYTSDKYTPDEIYDLAWCVEFVEHIPAEFKENYFSTFLSAKYLFMTYAPEGKSGYNHVNCQNEDYWIKELENINFSIDWDITIMLRKKSSLAKDFVRKNGLFFKNQNIN